MDRRAVAGGSRWGNWRLVRRYAAIVEFGKFPVQHMEAVVGAGTTYGLRARAEVPIIPLKFGGISSWRIVYGRQLVSPVSGPQRDV